MTARFVALICLSVIGCSRQSPPAETASNYDSEQLQPASREGAPGERTDTGLSPQPAPQSAPAPATARTDATPSGSMARPATPEPAQPGTPAGTQPDNTQVNERDRTASLTPLDQGNGEADLKLTQLIRKAVMDDDRLSFTAKNVKVITKDGKVTLRGPVKTAEERAAIEADARKAAGTAPIDNQIEVKK